MKYTEEQEKAIQLKKCSIKSLNTLLEGYINTNNSDKIKKAKLISYWLQEYSYFLNFESNFDPRKNIAYKRGDVIKLKFGFNIGSEYGGLHYAIILDNQNALSSPVVTVIPLTSIKPNTIVHRNSVDLGNGIYKALKFKHDTADTSLNAEIERITNIINLLETIIENNKLLQAMPNSSGTSLAIPDSRQILEQLQEQREALAKEATTVSKIQREINKMKQGSIALVNQITTISKMRIVDPRTTNDILSGISLSEENMEKINQKVQELYIFNKM